MIAQVNDLIEKCDQLGYILEEELATVLLLMLKLQKPLLLEGPPGVGKTEAANIIAARNDTELIRLQCYEGLDVNNAIYEWNYQKQLLSIKINEQSGMTATEQEDHIFSEDYLLTRPLLKAISASEKPPVLLIDEIDRADEEFEAFLLELLSDFQISIPEMGTIKARHRPIVILTSNRTRELSDALKRRCLYHWVPFPAFEKEVKIVQKHIPDMDRELLEQMLRFVAHLRSNKLQKLPGISESIDWANALIALSTRNLSPEVVQNTIGCVLKSQSDIEALLTQDIESIISNA